MRDARDAKSPERAVLEVIFKLREIQKSTLRAVGKASGDEVSFIPDDRRPDIIAVVRDVALTSITF